MAKFTKLNIGDAVASSGGRVWKKLSVESAEVQDELQGTWMLNTTLITTSNLNGDYKLDGTFNALVSTTDSALTSYPLYQIRVNGSSTASTLIVYGGVFVESKGAYCPNISFNSGNGKFRMTDKKGVSTAFLDNTDNRYYDARIFTITSKLSEVSNGDKLLAWLKTNATKQGSKPLIAFTIAGTSYQAEEGMTWGEFVSSKYNTNGIKIDSAGNVLSSVGQKIATAQYSGAQKSTDIIVANKSYIIQSSGGAD